MKKVTIKYLSGGKHLITRTFCASEVVSMPVDDFGSRIRFSFTVGHEPKVALVEKNPKVLSFECKDVESVEIIELEDE